MTKMAFFWWAVVCTLAGCGKGNDAPVNSGAATQAANTAPPAATTVAAPKIALFSRLRESVSKTGDEVFSMADGQLQPLPKDLPGSGPERDAYFAQKQIDGMIYYSEPGTLTWQMFATEEREAAGRRVDAAAWNATLALDVQHAIEAAKDDGEFADGITVEPGTTQVLLFRTARGVMGIVRATNEKRAAGEGNQLRVESKIVELK